MREIDHRNALIVKSNTLIESKYHLSVREQKFLIYLASLVKRDDMDFQYTSVRIKDVEAALKVGTDTKWGSIYDVIQEVVLNINKKPIMIRKPNGGWTLVNWFSSVDADPVEGLVTFELSETIKSQLVRLNEYFTKYRFGNILVLRSGYSIRIYELLKLNQFKQKVTYDLEYFRQLIGVSYMDEKQNWVHKYPEYKALKRSIINHAKKELKKETDIYFELKETREKRRVKYLTFYIFKNKNQKKSQQSELFAEPNQEVVPDDNFTYNLQIIEQLRSIGLTDAKAQKLYREGFSYIDDAAIRKEIVSNDRSVDEYLQEKIDYVHQRTQKGEVENPAGLLIKAVKENYVNRAAKQKEQKKVAKQRAKNRHQQKAAYEEQLRTMQSSLLEAELVIARQLIGGKEGFLTKVLANDHPELWLGYNPQFTLLDNVLRNESKLFVFKVLDRIKTQYPAKFAALENQRMAIQQKKRALQNV